MLSQLIILAVLIFLNAFFAASEIAFYRGQSSDALNILFEPLLWEETTE